MIRIGLMGLGTVGSGVCEIINKRKNSLKEVTGKEIEISKILVRDINKKRNVNVPAAILTTNPNEIVDDPNIDIVVEVMGGSDDTFEYMHSAINNGKHVVTANKEVVSKYLDKLSFLAKEKGKGFLFEASVGGGIPIIKPLKQHIKINDISEIKGILNGTTNFILTKMADENLSFDESLKLAQELGYAEADPTADIEGFDVARKLAILSSIAFKSKIKVEDIICRGITSISSLDINLFRQLGFVVKLLANSIIKENNFSSSVEPILLSKNSTLSTVNNAFNIVSVKGSTVGELQFYGQGAGKNPTANAVVCDIIDILTGDHKSDISTQNSALQSIGNSLFTGKYYIRITPEDKKQISNILNLIDKNNLNYDVIYKKDELVLITEFVSAKYINELIDKLQIFKLECCYLRIDGMNEENKKIAI